MVTRENVVPLKVSYQMTTNNQSFLDMHYWLKLHGIKNNKFFLVLYDTGLAGIDPRDPNLPREMALRVLRECMINPWYFLREIIRIPDQGGAVGGGVRFKLDRGNLALMFGFCNNWNMFLELPRQFGKTTSALCWYLWVFNFKTTNTEIMFMNKKHDDSKMNLRRLKALRDTLPSYLQMSEDFSMYGGKKLRATSNVETLSHPRNQNKITTKPGARSKANANGLGRGCTMPIHWYDEFAFIAYNDIIYLAATPAYKTASQNAKANGKPYGILITTTPGDLTTPEGTYAFDMKDNATPFREEFYDWSFEDLEKLRQANNNSNFFYIRFTYRQLGKGEDYFKEMVKDLNKDWPAIRREVLLEWATMSNNSPFTSQDLDIVKSLTKDEPIYKLHLGGNASPYYLDVWSQSDMRRFPPIIGVDVSGGFSKDSSAITVIDSRTTNVMGTFNCNFIPTNDLAKIIYELVVKYMPNAIVNVERNGGFGASVLQQLIKTKIKRNLYYEIKDRVIEERFDGMNTVKKSKKIKVYGFDETKTSRELLMEILRDRMENHKGKFIAPIIYNELNTLEVKKNGRIEHASNAHDDQIFSLLMALYVWYEGKNLMENFGIEIRQITTDNEEEIEGKLEEHHSDIVEAINLSNDEDTVKEQLEYLASNITISFQEWKEQQRKEDADALRKILQTPMGREAYAKMNHESVEDLEGFSMMTTLPNSLFYDQEVKENKLQKQFDTIKNIR